MMIRKERTLCKTLFLIFAAVFILLSATAYFYYLDLKKTFTVRVSEKATSLIGQPVEIGDITLSFSSGIKVNDLQIKNPEGFAPGQLLVIEAIILLPDYLELFKGRLHFSSINLRAPYLTVFKNAEGRLNISDKVRQLFSEKGTAEYRIDEIIIVSGVAAFNTDSRYRLERVNLMLKNLSSVRDAKTSLTGDFYWTGNNKIRLDGWAKLQDEPKQFRLSVMADDIHLSSFTETLMKYRIDPEKTNVKMLLDLGGDAQQGVSIRSGIQVRSPGHQLYRKGPIKLDLETDAFFNIADRAITVNNLTVTSNDESAVNIGGEIKISEKPEYDLDMRIGRLDLSGFNLFHGFTMSGILSSDLLNIKGGLDRFPGLNGSVEFKKGSVKSKKLELQKINGRVAFSPGQAQAAMAEFSSDILKAGNYPFSGPTAVKLLLNAEKSQQGLALSSTLTSSPVAMKISDKTDLSMKDVHIELDGVLRENLFSGKSVVNANGMRYDSSSFERLKSGFEFSYRDGDVILINPKIETELFYSSADAIKLDTRPKGEFSIEAKNLSGGYQQHKAAFRGANLSAILHMPGKEISGSINFMIAGASFEEFKSGKISGRAKFNPRGFTLDIPDANFSGGKVMLAAEGRTTQGPFPVKLKVTAEGVDLGVILPPGSGYMAGYTLSGDLKKGSFEGALVSKESIDGEMDLELQKFSVLNEKTKRHIVKDLSISPVIRLRGKDSEFRGAVSAGNIILEVSGTSKNFLNENRELDIRGKLNETPLDDIRTAFWDRFPDKFLYAGLEGSASSEVIIRQNRNRTIYEGNINLKNVLIEGENGEYSIGTVNGTIPFTYGTSDERKTAISLPSFERSEFEEISRHYTDAYPGKEYNRITVGNIRYGFRLLTDLTVWIKQDGSVLNIGRFSANIFGGKLNGSAVIDLSDGLQYRGGVILEGVSLTSLGNDIEPVKGYISGKLNGIGLVRGSEGGLSELIGRADFWTYATRDEKMRISREFLQKIGGPSIKPYLADRNFDKGIMSLYIQKGFFIFRELEISNRSIFGIQDLAVKVAPLSNRIAIDHLMWTIIEAAERAKQNGG